MDNFFITDLTEYLKVKYLIKVKCNRGMSEEDALHETVVQRYFSDITMPYIEDCYVAANLLAKDDPSFKEVCDQVTLMLQKGGSYGQCCQTEDNRPVQL